MFCSSFKLSFLQNTEESDRSEEEDLAQGLLQNTKIQAVFECGKAEQELGRRNVWAVLRIGKKYTKRKEYESTEELAVEMFLEFDT